MKPAITRFVEKCKPQSNGCIEWTASKNKCGYGMFWDKTLIQAHRWIYQYVHNKSITSDISICHTCDNPSCVNWDHLWEGTRSQNQIDAVLKNRHFTQKLNKEKVLEIRASNLSGKALAKLYSVTPQTICDIRNKRSWKHV